MALGSANAACLRFDACHADLHLVGDSDSREIFLVVHVAFRDRAMPAGIFAMIRIRTIIANDSFSQGAVGSQAEESTFPDTRHRA